MVSTPIEMTSAIYSIYEPQISYLSIYTSIVFLEC